MFLTMMKSKVHRATVTQAELNYVGSLTLDLDLMEAAEILPYEKVQVLNVHSGERFETYCIEGARGSGVVCLNGPAARLGQVGDIVIVLTYAMVDAKTAKGWSAINVHVDAKNKIVNIDRKHEAN